MRADRPDTVRVALRDFFRAARALPRDVTVVFLATAALTVLSFYYGSRGFFRSQYMESLGGDRFYSLYEYLYWFGAEFVLSFLVPLALIAFVHRGRLRDFGLGAGNVRFGLKIAAIFVAVMIPVVWIASDAEQFQLVYPHAQIVKGEWTLFFVYEAVFLLYFTGWEFLWRGYMLFGLERHLGGPVAVLVQMLPFVILHSGKPVLETFGAIVAGIALGALALRTRSFWYCVATHWFVMFAIDLCSTLRFRSGAQGIGVEAVLRVISHF